MPGPKNLRPEHKAIADAWIDNKGNGRQAVLKIRPDLKPESADVKASKVLNSDKVREYLESQAEGAASRVVELSIEAENENVRLNANKDILDRAGYKPVEKSQSIVANIDLNEKDNPKAKKLAEEYEEKLKESLLN